MGSEDNVRNIFLARALSALATYKAIAYPETPKEEIYALYDEAIREFGGGFNIKITQSRRMHYEMMISDRESFEDTCASYFDIGDSAEPVMMEDLIDSSARVEDWYGVYILVKALYVFYPQQVKALCTGKESPSAESMPGSDTGEYETEGVNTSRMIIRPQISPY